jgi:hypothetical protein
MMSPEDAEAWCEWYVLEAYPNADINGPPMPQGETSGKIGGYEKLYCYEAPWGGACLLRPTVEDCVRNILHRPCQATVAALTQCVEGMIAGNQAGADCPLPGTCDAFAAYGCDHTVVSKLVAGDGGGDVGCALHVE